ncbi:hypothetical protein BH23PLA1_BH23PLA1_38380 [soil metagenome]
MSRRRRILRWVLFSALAALTAQQTWRHTHDYIFPERFQVVDEGRVYRGAWPKTFPMTWVTRKHGIKTVVALAHPPESPWITHEREMGEKLGFEVLHIPIGSNRARAVTARDEIFDRLEEAADAIADPANQPVYFHCHHGVNRASLAQMAYRMLHCGYSPTQAGEEIKETIGLKRVDKGPDYRTMMGFYEDRVLPRLEAQAKAQASESSVESSSRR